MGIASYKELIVWQQAMALARDCYILTRHFPKEEMYGLTSQIRRAAASVPANIAEGSGRGTRADYQHFLRIAQGSLREVETYLLLSMEVAILAKDQLTPVLQQQESVSILLGKLIRSLQPKTLTP